jgi:hypothetical protein
MTTHTTATPEDFLLILRRIEIHAEISFRSVRCHHQRDDAISETIALCFHWFLRLRARGKKPELFPSILASYAVRAVRSGRRLCGQERAKDALSSVARVRHGFRVEPFPEFDTYEQENEAIDALRDNHRTPPDEQAAFRNDFPAWLSRLTSRKKAIALDMAMGHGTQHLAAAHNVSPARISQLRREFFENWTEFTEPAVV